MTSFPEASCDTHIPSLDFILTFNVEGGVGGGQRLSRDTAGRHTLEVARVGMSIHCCELQVAALLKAPVRVLHAPPILSPRELHVLRVADLTAQDGAAAV